MTIRYEKCLVSGCENNAHHDGNGKRGWCSKHYTRWLKYGHPETKKPVKSIAWITEHINYEGDDCIVWPFAIGADGYGRAHHPGTSRLCTASRLMCIFAHGEPPTPKHEAAHSCGNGSRACTNPRHIYWATPAVNHHDKIKHGTTNRGERQWQSKLSESDVRTIRKLIGTISQTAIAKRYKIDPSVISDIHRRKKWAWLT